MHVYHLDVSGNCYKVRLFTALTGIKLDLIPITLSAATRRTPQFHAINPFKEVPVLVDGNLIVRDTQAILIYLAGLLLDRRWWSTNTMSQALIAQWLSVASCEVRDGPNAARLIKKFGYALDITRALQQTDKLLPIWS